MITDDRQNFDPDYIKKELMELDAVLIEKLSIYLLGGAVMAINELKPGTRDVDVIVENERDHKILVDCLEGCGYILMQPQNLSKPYNELSATTLENLDRFRWEIFIQYVAKKLKFSDTMKNRARSFYSGKKINVYLLSNEDIFLLKGMTERDRDLEDMAILVRSGLNYDAIIDECIDQSNKDQRGNNWEASLELKYHELKEQYGIEIPFIKKLREISEKRLASGSKRKI